MDTNQPTISRDMTGVEIQVLNAIKCASYDLPVTAAELRVKTGLSKRNLEKTIESLRVNFRHPIVAKKYAPNGYYLPKNNEERREGLAPYNRQIETEQKNVAMIMGVDLEKYWKGVENG